MPFPCYFSGGGEISPTPKSSDSGGSTESLNTDVEPIIEDGGWLFVFSDRK